MAEPVAVRRVVDLPVPRREVWEAVTRPGLLDAWLGEVLELAAEPGGRVAVRTRDGSMLRGRVEIVDPPRRLVLRWRRPGWSRLGGGPPGLPPVGVATRVELVLDPVAAGTRLTVSEERVDAVAAGAPGEAVS